MIPLISALLPGLFKIVERFLPEDPAKAQEMQMELIKQINQLDMSQMEVNKTEAGNPSVFVSGWRPFIGWVCGAALAMNFLLFPLLEWACALYGNPVKFPTLEMTELIGILMGMLGMGGLRTFEKIKGVARKK